MFDKHCKAIDVVRGTKIGASVISKYLSGKSGISAENLIKLSQHLNVSPDWLLNGSDAPESVKVSKSVSVFWIKT